MAAEAVDKLIHVRDHYFENNGVETAGDKGKVVAAAQAEALKALDAAPDQSSAAMLYLRGRALNVSPAFDQAACDALSKAVKLDPAHAPAWNELAECFWKGGNKTQAKTCFEKSIELGENAVGLRGLSMLMRQLPGEALEKQNNVRESLEVAKRAIMLDMTDGQSWFVLGNAYLALFFANMETVDHVKQALKAYKKAEMDKTQAVNNPDLHHNRAGIHLYQEDYALALEGYQLAALLDPEWPDPKAAMEKIKARTLSVCDLIKEKGRLKKSRLQDMIAGLNDKDAEQFVALSTLMEGINVAKVRGAVLYVEPGEQLPQTFLLADKEGTCQCLTVYNMDAGAIKVGDVIVVPDPFFRKITVGVEGWAATAGKPLAYDSIRVDDPLSLVVNGTALHEDKLAKSELRIAAKSD